MLTGLYCGSCSVANSIVSTTSLSDGRGGKTNSVLGVELFGGCRSGRSREAYRGEHRLVGEGHVEREQHGGRCVDGHRDADLAEIDALVEPLEVGEGVDRDATAADLTLESGSSLVPPHQRGQVEGGAQAHLALAEQVVKSLVGLRGRSEARELAHRPELFAVHLAMRATGVNGNSPGPPSSRSGSKPARSSGP